MVQVENYHIFEVKYLSPTTYKGARVSIKSHRFNQWVVIPYNYRLNSISDMAGEYLKERGYNIIGCGELSNGNSVIISDTFEPLK